jgi:hypothetical protein
MRIRTPRPRTFVAFLLPVTAVPAVAAQVSFQPGAQLYADYDSNRVLLPGISEGASAMLAATVRATRAAELSSLVLDARAARHVYEGRDLPDVNAMSVNLSGRRASERGVLRAEASWIRDSAFEAERIASGIPAVDSRQEQRRAGAGYRFAQGERATLDIDASWLETSYGGVTAANIRGFRYPNLALTQGFATTERTNLSFAASIGELDPGLPGFETRNLSGNVLVRHEFSERSSVSVSLGATRQTRFGRSSTGAVASLALALRPDDRTRLSLDAARRVLPSGTGQLVSRESFAANLSRGLSPTWSLTTGFNAIRNRRLGLGDLLVDRYDYAAADVGATWRPRPAWEAGLRVYAARGQQVETGPRLDAVGIALSLNWLPQGTEPTP